MLGPLCLTWLIITRTRWTNIAMSILQMEKSELRKYEYLTKSNQLSKGVELTIQLLSVWLQTPSIFCSLLLFFLLPLSPSPSPYIFSCNYTNYLCFWLIKMLWENCIGYSRLNISSFFFWILNFRKKQLSKWVSIVTKSHLQLCPEFFNYFRPFCTLKMLRFVICSLIPYDVVGSL